MSECTVCWCGYSGVCEYSVCQCGYSSVCMNTLLCGYSSVCECTVCQCGYSSVCECTVCWCGQDCLDQHNTFQSYLLWICGYSSEQESGVFSLSTVATIGYIYKHSMKGELGGLVAVVASWLSGYGGYSQIPWVQVPQLPVFLFSPFSPSRLGCNETSIIQVQSLSICVNILCGFCG